MVNNTENDDNVVEEFVTEVVSEAVEAAEEIVAEAVEVAEAIVAELQTDEDIADRVYVEPISLDYVTEVIAKERARVAELQLAVTKLEEQLARIRQL